MVLKLKVPKTYCACGSNVMNMRILFYLLLTFSLYIFKYLLNIMNWYCYAYTNIFKFKLLNTNIILQTVV
jgi:hypothetical protein